MLNSEEQRLNSNHKTKRQSLINLFYNGTQFLFLIGIPFGDG